MSRIQNVLRKDGLYYFRRQVRLGSDKPFRLRLSLRTTSPKVAKVFAPMMALACERLAMNMMANMAGDGLTAHQRAEIYRRQILVERDRLELMHAKLQVFPPDDHEDIEQALAVRLNADEIASRDGVAGKKVDDFITALIDPDDDDAPILLLAWSDLAKTLEGEDTDQAAIARLNDLGVAPSAIRTAIARKVVSQARVEAIQEFRHALINPSSAYASVPVVEFDDERPVQIVPTEPLMQPRADTASARSEYASMTPTQACEKFFELNVQTGGPDGTLEDESESWTAKTREQFRLPALLIEEVMQGKPLASISQSDLVALHGIFRQLHGKSFRKAPRHRTMTIHEIVAETSARVKSGELTVDDLGLTVATRNRHWGFLRTLTDWFAKQHPIAALDYAPFIRRDKRNARELRATFTNEQLVQLFKLSPWTGARSVTDRLATGDLIVHDAFYWVPLIGLYSGMRRDEICGLELDDIVCEKDQWHFAVRDNSLRSLKTASSIRKIPFADELIRLGLPGYIEALRREGERVLFPELLGESGKGTMGDAFYKRCWTKVAKVMPDLAEGQGIHSMRHTAIDRMKLAGIDSELRADFAGHHLESQTEGRYSKAHLVLIKNAIDTIPNVTSHLAAGPINLLPKALRSPRKARPVRPVS